MKLYVSPTSPFVRKVKVAVQELGLSDRVEMVAQSGTPLAPNEHTIAVNPLGKVPCLVMDDGRALSDSRVITRYLDTLGQTKLYPEGAELWDCLRLEAMADGMMEATLAIAFESRLRAPEIRLQSWVDAQWEKVSRAMAHIEAEWMDYLHGPLDMAQLAVAVACDYADMRAGDRNWRDSCPLLSAWQVEFAKRPSLASTLPKL